MSTEISPLTPRSTAIVSLPSLYSWASEKISQIPKERQVLMDLADLMTPPQADQYKMDWTIRTRQQELAILKEQVATAQKLLFDLESENAEIAEAIDATTEQIGLIDSDIAGILVNRSEISAAKDNRFSINRPKGSSVQKGDFAYFRVPKEKVSELPKFPETTEDVNKAASLTSFMSDIFFEYPPAIEATSVLAQDERSNQEITAFVNEIQDQLRERDRRESEIAQATAEWLKDHASAVAKLRSGALTLQDSVKEAVEGLQLVWKKECKMFENLRKVLEEEEKAEKAAKLAMTSAAVTTPISRTSQAAEAITAASRRVNILNDELRLLRQRRAVEAQTAEKEVSKWQTLARKKQREQRLNVDGLLTSIGQQKQKVVRVKAKLGDLGEFAGLGVEIEGVLGKLDDVEQLVLNRFK